jgi:hypothetical protein
LRHKSRNLKTCKRTDRLSLLRNSRFDTPRPRSSPPSRPAPAVPTSEFPSRTPERPLRPSTAGSCSELSSSSRTSRSTRRPSPCDDMPAALAAPPKVRPGNPVSTIAIRFRAWVILWTYEMRWNISCKRELEEKHYVWIMDMSC